MSLFIHTLNWNGKEKLESLYPGLMEALNGIDYTWLIKDNASKDGSVEYLSSLGNSNIRCISYKNNLQNFSAGMNYLFQEASPKDDDLILLLNNDVIINNSNSLKNMINIINSDPNVGVVGARLLFTNTSKLQHAGVVFDPKHKLPCHFRANEYADKASEKNRLFQIVTGAVLLTKAEYYRNIWTQNKSGIHGMDENFHWSFDDCDLCLSIGYNLKKKIVYCGQTNIFHEESATLKKNPANYMFMQHNANYLKSKWGAKYVIDRDIYTSKPTHNLYER